MGGLRVRPKNPLAEQAQGPFLYPQEHGFADAACVVNRACTAPYGGALEQLWPGSCTIAWPADIDPAVPQTAIKPSWPVQNGLKVDITFDRIALAIAAFESSAEVNPFSSRFDAWLAGKDKLTKQEQLGLNLFNKKGKCAKCHTSKGKRPLFTDFTYDNLGIPRNPANPFYKQTAYNPEREAWIDPGTGRFSSHGKALSGQVQGPVWRTQSADSAQRR